MAAFAWESPDPCPAPGLDFECTQRAAAADLEWIEFVKRLRATGMPVRLMARFAQLRRLGRRTVPERARMLDEHPERVQAQIAELSDHLDAIAAKRALHEAQLIIAGALA